VKAARVLQSGQQLKHYASLVTELRMLRRMRHPNIVLFYGACIDTATMDIMLVLEYVRGPTVTRILTEHPEALNSLDRCKILSDCCCALRYLHGSHPVVVHGDIKGCNILMETVGVVWRAKLVDFGLSALLTRNVSGRTGGTLKWAAPEVLRDACPHPTPASDMFSFGRLIFFVVTSRPPLREVDSAQVLCDALSGEVTKLAWPGQQEMPLLTEASSVADACMSFDPADRPTIVQVHADLLEWPVVDSPGLEGLGEAARCSEHFPTSADNCTSEHAFGKVVQDLRRGLAEGTCDPGCRRRPPPLPMCLPDSSMLHPEPPAPHMAARETGCKTARL